MEQDLTLVTGVTGQVCAQCGDELEYGEEVFLLQVARAFVTAEGNSVLHIALDDDGDFLYEPHFVHFKCWEEIEEELKEELQNEPPVPAPQELLPCRCCGSGIQAAELLGAIQLGELHLSKRSPPGAKRGEDFEEAGDPFLFCIYCLNLINDNWLEFWGHGMSEEGECSDCIQARCWRLPALLQTCPCTCHAEQEEG